MTQIIASIVDAGGGLNAPEGPSIGRGVLLSGSCEEPVKIVRDLGQLLPVKSEGLEGTLEGYSFEGEGTTDEDEEATPVWSVTNRVPVRIGQLMQGVMVVAVLDDSFPSSVLQGGEVFKDNVVFGAAEDPEGSYADPEEGILSNDFFLDLSDVPEGRSQELRERQLACGPLHRSSLLLPNTSIPGGSPTPDGSPTPSGSPMPGPTPTPTTMIGGAQFAAVARLAMPEDSGWVGVASLSGKRQQQMTQIMASLVNAGGGLGGPEGPSVGHAILLAGSCEDPRRVVRDLGQLLPTSATGLEGEVEGFSAASEDTADDHTEGIPIWSVVNQVPVRIDQLTGGFLVVAVLDDVVPPASINENELFSDDETLGYAPRSEDAFRREESPELNETFLLEPGAISEGTAQDLRDRQLACGEVNQLLTPDASLAN